MKTLNFLCDCLDIVVDLFDGMQFNGKFFSGSLFSRGTWCNYTSTSISVFLYSWMVVGSIVTFNFERQLGLFGCLRIVVVCIGIVVSFSFVVRHVVVLVGIGSVKRSHV